MDNMTNLQLLLDYFERTVSDLQTIRNAMFQNDMVALRALLRYFRHLRDYTGLYEPTPVKREAARVICDIIEKYIDDHRSLKEV